MREYIFYVFLVFLPIGALMVKILYDHGLPIKNIAYIVLTSLAIVITFPISMERLGVLLAFTVYAILILLIILYMVKTADNVSLDAVASSAVSDNKIEIDNKKEPNHKDNLALDTKISDNSDKQFQSVLTESFEQEEVVENAMEDIVGIDINSSEDLIETIIRDRDITLASDDIKLPIEDENIDDINFAIKDNIIEEMKAELNNESVEENSVIEDSELTKGVEETAAIAAEQETLAIETPETDNSVIVIENEEIKSQEELNEELISYINDAFKYKTEGNDEKAIEKFLLIWENTKDYDLKHLVTLELVQMYKTAGLYTSAQELLTLFYEEIKEINIFLASQLNQELTYINLLLSEIERLGLEQVPFDKLPRWVKIKVADELNQLE